MQKNKNFKYIKILTVILGIINAGLLITSIVTKTWKWFLIALAITFGYNAIIVLFRELTRKK